MSQGIIRTLSGMALLLFLLVAMPSHTAMAFVVPRSDDHHHVTASFSSTALHDGTVVDVVLMGVGDLRLDDHGGLQAAALAKVHDDKHYILPVFAASPEQLAAVPGMVAHTHDTAHLIAAAVQDVADQFLEAVQVPLTTVLLPKSNDNDNKNNNNSNIWKTTIQSLVQQAMTASSLSSSSTHQIRVHACDLGPADQGMGYGALAQLSSLDDDNDNFVILPWTDALRPPVTDLPDEYPTYVARHVRDQPAVPPHDTVAQLQQTAAAANKPDTVFLSAGMGSVPSGDDLVALVLQVYNSIDPLRLSQEINTGLFQTHWGGLSYDSVGSRTVLAQLQAYDGNDETWWNNNNNNDNTITAPRAVPNPRSLEHASMQWQLDLWKNMDETRAIKANQWLAGEGMVRYLTAPLLLGTVSVRRVWQAGHAITTAAGGPLQPALAPLEQMAESREWHKLLATHQLSSSTKKETTDDIQYKYWRYMGFLCRYAVLSPATDENNNNAAESVVLIHGFGASGAQWEATMTELRDRQTTTTTTYLAPDLLGFGHAEKPAVSYTGYLWDSQILDFVKEHVTTDSYVTGGNSIGGFTAMSLAACDAAPVSPTEDDTSSSTKMATSSGAPGTTKCNGLVLMNSAGPILTADEVNAIGNMPTMAQVTASGQLAPCAPPPRWLGRIIGNGLLAYLRPRIQSICTNLYPTNPAAVNDRLCTAIRRDSLDPGALNVMMAGSKLPTPRTANELLAADFGGPSADGESTFAGPVLVAQGVLDPLNNSPDRLQRLGNLRAGITMDPLQAGHCPHDELPAEVAESMTRWMASRTATASPSTVAAVSGSSQ